MKVVSKVRVTKSYLARLKVDMESPMVSWRAEKRYSCWVIITVNTRYMP